MKDRNDEFLDSFYGTGSPTPPLHKPSKSTVMNSKEKAQELVDKYRSTLTYIHQSTGYAKLCALIAVDEIIAAFEPYKGMYDQDIIDADKKYYQEVKTHIQNIK